MADELKNGALIVLFTSALFAGALYTSQQIPAGDVEITSIAIPRNTLYQSMFIVKIIQITPENLTVGVYPKLPTYPVYYSVAVKTDNIFDISSPIENSPGSTRMIVVPSNSKSVAMARETISNYNSMPIARWLAARPENYGITMPFILVPTNKTTTFYVYLTSDHGYLGGLLTLGNQTYELPVVTP